MSGARALLLEAQDAGVRLQLAKDGKLKVSASTPPELLDRLRALKLELAALLRGECLPELRRVDGLGRGQWASYSRMAPPRTMRVMKPQRWRALTGWPR